MNDDSDRLIGIREVAEVFGVDISTIRRWERAGHLRSVRIGDRGHRRFWQQDIDSLIESRLEDEAGAKQGSLTS